MAPYDVYNMNEIGVFCHAQQKQETKHKGKFAGAKFRRNVSLLLLL